MSLVGKLGQSRPERSGNAPPRPFFAGRNKLSRCNSPSSTPSRWERMEMHFWPIIWMTPLRRLQAWSRFSILRSICSLRGGGSAPRHCCRQTRGFRRNYNARSSQCHGWARGSNQGSCSAWAMDFIFPSCRLAHFRLSRRREAVLAASSTYLT